MAAALEVFLTQLPDPRADRGRRHLFTEIMTIAVLATICGAEGPQDMEEFGLAKEQWLRTFLTLPHGIPSHDTFGKILASLDPNAFEAMFRAWTAAVAGGIRGVLAIDGKTLRRSFDHANNRSPIHMVSAWSSANGAVFGQVVTDEKSNEITAIPELLKSLQLKGLIVTIDAIGCQKAIAKQIVEKKGDYLLQVKANQPGLLEDAKDAFAWGERREFKDIQHSKTVETNKGHGRIEIREVSVMWTPQLLRDPEAWSGVSCVVQVRSTRVVGAKTSTDCRYFISSVPPERATDVAAACRAHWGVENGLHWCLDVTFCEDQSRVRMRNAAENLSRLRRLALNLLKQETSRKTSIKAKRFRAGLDEDYLLKVISG